MSKNVLKLKGTINKKGTEIKFNDSAVGVIENNILLNVKVNNKRYQKGKIFDKYNAVFIEKMEALKGKEEKNIVMFTVSKKEKKEYQEGIKPQLEVDRDKIIQQHLEYQEKLFKKNTKTKQEKKSTSKNDDNLNVFDPKKIPIRNDMVEFLQFNDSDFIFTKQSSKALLIDDTCKAVKEVDEKGNKIQFTRFTMTIETDSKILSNEIKNAMFVVMEKYLSPYNLKFDRDNIKELDNNGRYELRIDLNIPFIKGCMSELRKYVHVVYFIAKKEVKAQYNKFIHEQIKNSKKNEKIV